MSTIRIAVDDELADGIEEFFNARGIEFGGENIIRATDHSKPTKPRPKFYDVVNTSIKSFAKVLSEYLDMIIACLHFETMPDHWIPRFILRL
jgi:hypothetical protein